MALEDVVHLASSQTPQQRTGSDPAPVATRHGDESDRRASDAPEKAQVRPASWTGHLTDRPSPSFPLQGTPRVTARTTAADLLSRFGAVTHRPSSGSNRTTANAGTARTPVEGLPRKSKICYIDLDDSDDPQDERRESTAAGGTGAVLSADAGAQDVATPADGGLRPERTSFPHFLRTRAASGASPKAAPIVMQQPHKRKYTAKSASASAPSSHRRPARMPSNRNLTSRQAIRYTIATETAAKRARFFRAKKDYFLPLLPESNYIQKLLDKEAEGAVGEPAVSGAMDDVSAKPMASEVKHELLKDSDTADQEISPYVPITEQPQGVKAIMKPYQLSGLSFLLYLHRNGLSGILGDEMGLGKTLQTLSLFQYLKEHEPASSSGRETRPFLVVCPLSVLSSWMTEARRWTPDLKVLRFHGPMAERNHLKKVAEGLEDHHGNRFERPAKKRKIDQTSAGNVVISLDTDPSDNERQTPTRFDVVVTTYETFQAEQNWFKRVFVWRYVVLDEGHKIKNDLSLIANALQSLDAEFRLILTGTPLQNNLTELWALLHWLYPEVFTEKTCELFRTSFDLTNGRINTSVMDDARRLLELIMLRRMKSSPSVNLDLPPKHEVLLFVPLTPMQRFWYTRLLTRTDRGLLEELFQGAKEKELMKREEEMEEEKKTLMTEDPTDGMDLDAVGTEDTDRWAESREILKRAVEQETLDSAKTSAWRKLMNLLMQLRKCCNHPYLLANAEPDPYFLGDHIIRASGKFIVLEKLVSELVIKQGEKVLFFSGFTKMLDLCEDFLTWASDDSKAFKFVRLDGGTARARRNLNIRLFNTKPDYRVVLISTRAGSLGINLATATKVVLLDQDWNPQVTLQAEARAHRLGQTKPVTVYKLCTQGTVEEQMMGRIQKKLYLSAKVTESIRDIHTDSPSTPKRGRPGGGTEEDMPQMGTSELMSLVRRGAQALAHREIDVNEMLGWDWETTLSECKHKSFEMEGKPKAEHSAEEREQQEQEWLASMEKVESYVFDGKKYARKAAVRKEEASAEDLVREDRRIGKNVTVMVDGFAVNKESMRCEDWEAVPTMAGKDLRLAEPKREKRRAVENQDYCQVCWEGGQIVCCTGCPRAYHYDCLDDECKGKSKRGMFYCSQHECFDCGGKTSNAGGLIFRCRWCERGYCEDCLEWDRTEFIGDTLPEYTQLGFPAVNQACYIVCPICIEQHEQDPAARRLVEQMTRQFDPGLAGPSEPHPPLDESGLTKERPSRAESLTTNATTIEVSEVTTPAVLTDSMSFSKPA